jgi:F-box/leucine-rich repeat protein 14
MATWRASTPAAVNNLTENRLGHAFVQEISNLGALNLNLCKQITSSSLGHIAQYLNGLEVLEPRGCSNITNTSLLVISWSLQCLKSLYSSATATSPTWASGTWAA